MCREFSTVWPSINSAPETPSKVHRPMIHVAQIRLGHVAPFCHPLNAFPNTGLRRFSLP